MTKNKKFSKMIKELEVIVNDLEKDNSDVEQSFSLYKKGMDLSKDCFFKLQQIEDQITIVTEENGVISEEESSREELSGEEVRTVNKKTKEENQNDVERNDPNVLPGQQFFPGML